MKPWMVATLRFGIIALFTLYLGFLILRFSYGGLYLTAAGLSVLLAVIIALAWVTVRQDPPKE